MVSVWGRPSLDWAVVCVERLFRAANARADSAEVQTRLGYPCFRDTMGWLWLADPLPPTPPPWRMQV